MTSLALAWRSLSREPARVVLGIIGVAAVGALLFDMLLLSRGLLVSFRDLLDSVGFDVRVTATEALPTMGPPLQQATSLAASIRRLPQVEEVVPIRLGRGTISRAGGAPLRVSLIGSTNQGDRRRAWTLLRGSSFIESAPHEAPRMLVNRPLAEDLELAPGSKLRLTPETPGIVSALPPTEFLVVGIADFPFQSAHERIAATSFNTFRAARGGLAKDEADLLLVAARAEAGPSGAVAAIQRLRPDLHAFSNEQILTRFSSTDFSYFRQISFLLSSVTLFFAFLLVTTLLTVAVNQRFAEVATLRAIGFSRRRVAADLLAESALLVGAGGVLSIPIGAGLARVLDGILRQMPWLSERLHFFVFDARTVVLYAVLLAAAALLAAAYPIALAVRLPIAATLRNEVVS